MFLCFYLQFSGLKARLAVVLIRLVIKALFNDVFLMKSPASILDGLRNIIVRSSLGVLGCEEGLCCIRVDKGNLDDSTKAPMGLWPFFCCLHNCISWGSGGWRETVSLREGKGTNSVLLLLFCVWGNSVVT